MKKKTELSNVEQVALKMFDIQMAVNMSMNNCKELEPKDISTLIEHSFQMAYKFLDESKKFQRAYD